MPEGIPRAATDEATADLTSWMLKWGWMPGLTEDQVRKVCEDAAGRVLELAAPIIAQKYADLLASIGLYINWRYVTRQLTTEQKELFADAIDADGLRTAAQEGPAWGEPTTAERWWRDA
jgi:hypothetical protein